MMITIEEACAIETPSCVDMRSAKDQSASYLPRSRSKAKDERAR